MWKYLVTLVVSSLAWTQTIEYKPSHVRLVEKEVRIKRLKESTKLYPAFPLKTGLDWGKCGDVKQGVYVYVKNAATPIELRTFTSIKSTFASQAEMWDKQGIKFTGKLRPKKELQPVDLDVQFTSNSLLFPQKMGLETTLKIKY